MQTTGVVCNEGSGKSDPHNTPFFSGPFAAFTSHALRCATVHATSKQILRLDAPRHFKDSTRDTGSARASISSPAQFKAHCIFTRTKSGIGKAQKALVHFGIGEKTSLDTATIPFPVNHIWLYFNGHVVDKPIAMLAYMDEMHEKWYLL